MNDSDVHTNAVSRRIPITRVESMTRNRPRLVSFQVSQRNNSATYLDTCDRHR